MSDSDIDRGVGLDVGGCIVVVSEGVSGVGGGLCWRFCCSGVGGSSR